MAANYEIPLNTEPGILITALNLGWKRNYRLPDFHTWQYLNKGNQTVWIFKLVVLTYQ